jgi:hypothetical protein
MRDEDRLPGPKPFWSQACLNFQRFNMRQDLGSYFRSRLEVDLGERRLRLRPRYF